MRTAISLLSLSLALTATTLLGGASPASAAPTVEIKPGSLPRGADPAVPYVDGSDVVDGERRLPTGGDEVRLLGTWRRSVVVAVAYDDARPQRVLRLRPDGTRAVVARRVDIGSVALSDDGSRLVSVAAHQRRSTVTVRATGTGEVVAQRTQRGYVEAHDVARGRVLLVSYRPDRTLVWRTGPDTTRVVLRRATSYGDLGTDRLAWLAGDPYSEGCGVLSTISDPTARIWRSCRDVVVSVSPDGSRLISLHKLTDGLGPVELRVRDADGTLLATYRTDGWFLDWQWESGDDLLLGVNGRNRYALVRCTDGDCERTTPTRPAEQPRAVA